MWPAPPDGPLRGHPGATVIRHGLRRPEKDFRRVAKLLADVLPARLKRLRRFDPAGTCRR